MQLLVLDVSECLATPLTCMLWLLMYKHMFGDVRPLAAPVVTHTALVRLLRVVYPQMSLQVRLAGELLGADAALKQHFRRHVHHLHMHLQDVHVLGKRWRKIIE